MLTFAHAWAFWILPLPLLVRWLIPAKTRPNPAVRVPFLERVSDVAEQSEASSAIRRWLLPSVLWLLVVAALVRPQWLEDPIERSIPTRDLLLLVDLSASMQHKDFLDPKGNPVDRLTALKDVLGDFLVRRDGDRVGLVVFGNSPFLQVPFSTDLELSRRLLDETAVGMAGPRTALGDAIGLGIQLFDESSAPAKTIIALTDGNDNASAVPPTEAARVAADRKIIIHTIAMGDPTTVGEEKIDERELNSVAEVTGGQSFLALDRKQLEGVYDRLDQIETRETKTISHRPRRDLYYWPLAIAVLIACLRSFLNLRNRPTHTSGQLANSRLRVNARTFELETTST